MGGKKQVIKLNLNNINKPIDEAFNEFILKCMIHNLSEYTIIFYKENYKQFKIYATSQSLDDTRDINSRVFDSYILHLKEKQRTTVSVNTRIRGIRAFLYFCMKEEYIDEFRIKTIKVEKKVKETYTDAELNLLLKKPNVKECTFAEYRDWVIINYLLSTGNRLRTVINVKIKNLDFENKYILLERTKNKRQQLIPMSNTLSKVLLEYLKYRKGENEEFLFCNVSGQQLTKDSIINTIKKYNHSRGVVKSSIHLFRHTFAKKWILSGGDVFRLQSILGHNSLEVVKEYVNIFGDELKKNFDNFNPLEQLTSNHTNARIKI